MSDLVIGHLQKVFSSDTLGTANEVIDAVNSLQGFTGGGDVGVSRTKGGYVVEHFKGHPIEPAIIGKIVSSGPKGETDFPTTSPFYWVQKSLVVYYNGSHSIATIDPLTSEDMIFPVFNIGEYNETTSTHTLKVGTYIVAQARVVFPATDRSDTSNNVDKNDKWVYVMDISAPGTTGGGCSCAVQYSVCMAVAQNQPGCDYVRAHPLI